MDTSKQEELQTFTEKVLQGMRQAVQTVIEQAAAENDELVIGDEEGNCRKVPARELLQKLQQ
ncbi:hypothetical protein [Deminuibacter soli]|uniref:Uncharacterized protein n=1 Tax=Deminuibacter soli TaxID=2291815 RepID=A0A3E1NQS1_9BACT|nr:hypothetical protein [Deminuibacter soli]RFM30138.1 hypothetical protein DXN05_03965 [Deminuibacter soli]